MIKKSKLLIVLILLSAISYMLFANMVSAQVNKDFINGLVPCGTSYAIRACTVCDFYKLIQNIINFFLFVSAPLATLVAVYIGFLFLISGGSPAKITDAKGKLWLLIVGIFWVLGSWLVLNTIINLIADPKVFIKAPWYQIKCNITVAPSISSLPTPAPVDTNFQQDPDFKKLQETVLPTRTNMTPSSEAITKQATRILTDHPGSFSTNADCPGYNADRTMREVAGGSLPSVCTSQCSCATGGASGKVTVDSRVLALVDRVLNAYNQNLVQVKVSSLTTGQHEVDSRHYQGRAVDFEVADKNPKTATITYDKLEVTLRSYLGGDTFVQCEKTAKPVNCKTGAPDHIHVQYNRQ